MQQTPRRKVAMMHQLWTRRHIVRVLSFTGATLLHPILAWTQPQDTMAPSALPRLASCPATPRRQGLYPFEAKARRDGPYVPRRRPGLPLGALTPTPHALLWRLRRAGLSDPGVQKTRGVLAPEAILGARSGRLGERDPGNYARVVFGSPASGPPWGWRFAGPHLSLTWTVVPGQGVAVTP